MKVIYDKQQTKNCLEIATHLCQVNSCRPVRVCCTRLPH